MTFDEIIKAKEHFQYGINCDLFSEPVTSYAKTAVEALEKQIPKKPIGDGWGSFLKLCPNCKSKAIYDHKNLEPRKYCDNCGQALDWSNEK